MAISRTSILSTLLLAGIGWSLGFLKNFENRDINDRSYIPWNQMEIKADSVNSFVMSYFGNVCNCCFATPAGRGEYPFMATMA